MKSVRLKTFKTDKEKNCHLYNTLIKGTIKSQTLAQFTKYVTFKNISFYHIIFLSSVKHQLKNAVR